MKPRKAKSDPINAKKPKKANTKADSMNPKAKSGLKQTKKAKKHVKKQPSTKRRQHPKNQKAKKVQKQTPQSYPGAPESYYHALVKNLSSEVQPHGGGVSAESIMFSKLLALSAIRDEEQYKAGFRIGKLYYAKAYKPAKYKWYEDAIPTLMSLLQHCGYKATYGMSSLGNPVITLKQSHSIYMGCDMHSFESGIISGFLSRAKNSYVRMYERKCSCNGYEECVFGLGVQSKHIMDSAILLKRFASHLQGSHIKAMHNDFSLAYNAAILAPIKHAKVQYSSMYLLGEYVQNEFGFLEVSTLPVRMIMEIIKKVSAYESLESSEGSVSMVFDPLNSDSSYIESLSQFIKGLTGNIATVSQGLSDSGLNYTLTIDFGAKLLKLKNK